MASTAIAHAWITGRENIVVVITHDPVNRAEPYKARITPVVGKDADEDLDHAMNNGVKINLVAAYWLIFYHGIFYTVAQKREFREHVFTKEVPNG